MRSLSRIALAALVLTACPVRVLANEAWTALSPLPFGATSIAVEPGAPGTLWAAGAKDGRLAKSTDGGRTWEDVSVGCSPGYYFFVAAAPGETSTVYASASACGLLRSVDGGQSWQTLAKPIGGAADHLVIDPADSSILYSSWYDYGTCFDVSCFFKSTDGGRSWKGLALDPATAGSLDSMGIDPSAHGTLYFGTAGSGLWKSVDGGETWRSMAGPVGVNVSRISVDPRRSGSLFAATENGLFKSVDGGGSWSATGPGGAGLVSAIVFDSGTNPSTIYAGIRDGVLRSRNAGESWEPLRDGLTGPIDALALAGGPAPVLYALSTHAIYSLVLNGAPVSYLVPSATRAPGAHGAFYTTDLSIANAGSIDAQMTIQFLGHDADGRTGPTATRLLAAGRAVTYADVLGSMFALESGYGAIRITSDSGSLRVQARSWTRPPDGRGSVGESVPAFDAARLATPLVPAVLIGLEEDASFRSNLVLANASEISATVVATLYSSDGATLGTGSWTLPPLGMTQVGSVVAVLGGPAGARDTFLLVSVATPGAQVAAYATVTDNLTNDPRAILP